MATTAAKTRVKLSITLDEDLHDQYAERAAKRGIPVEKEIAERLKGCAAHTSGSGLYFDDAQRAKLQHIIGHVIQTPEDVLSKLGRLIGVTAGDVKVPIDPRVQLRLKTRVFRGETVESVIRREVSIALEKFTGIRPY